jgi:hypothetical protein
MTKWSHMRSKFMGCDSIVNAIRTVRIQSLLLVRLVFNCATNHALRNWPLEGKLLHTPICWGNRGVIKALIIL